MSEPAAALFRLHIARADLVRWLDASARPASAWTDWCEIGGTFCFDDFDGDIPEVGEAELLGDVAKAMPSWRILPGTGTRCDGCSTRPRSTP